MFSTTRSSITLLSALTVATVLGAPVGSAQAATFWVNVDDDQPDVAPGDGSCATYPGMTTCSLRAAVMEANAWPGADTIIVVVGGTIDLTTTGAGEWYAETGDLNIAEDVTIFGQGVVIDGQGDDAIFTVKPRVTAEISGVTLQHGFGGWSGGAIYNSGELLLSDSVLRYNVSDGVGGAIYSTGILRVIDSVIHDNDAERGGGLHSSGTMEVVGSNVHDNYAVSYGGGIYLPNTSVDTTITDSDITRNVTGGQGGGIWTVRSIDLTRSTLSENEATAGGGLYMWGEHAVVDAYETDFVDNEAWLGGGIHNREGDLTLRRVGIWGNEARVRGGGIYSNIGSVVALRGAIYDNDAEAGGGIYHVQGDLQLKNMTISGNEATEEGGGVRIAGESGMVEFMNVTVVGNTGITGGLDAGGTANLVNTLIANNHDLAGVRSDCVGDIVSEGHNLIRHTVGCNITGSATGDIYNEAPRIGVLTDNGCETPTHRLLVDSPAVDTGDDAACLPVDQRGINRPQGVACDIGAFEMR